MNEVEGGTRKLVVNGERRVVQSSSLGALIGELGLHGQRCATMVNGKIVRRPDREVFLLADGDQVDVIAMVGGG